jgi:FkbM family methyltransferase
MAELDLAMAKASVLRRMLNRLESEAANARLLRGWFFKQRLSTLLGSAECSVRMAGVGPISLRPRSTDLASFRRVFEGDEYRIPDAAADAVKSRYQAILAADRTPVIVDAGAYVGAAAIFFARCFPQAHVVALEPDEDSFRLLKSNLRDHPQVTAIQAAAAGERGHVRLVRRSEAWATQVERSNEGIPSMTMNEAFASVPNGEPFIAKMNIEGFETDVFSGAFEWLDKIGLLFIEPHDWLLPGKHTSRSFQRALGERDFDLFIVGPHLCYARV